MPYWRPKLTVEVILRWADAHHRWTGEWPGTASGPIAGAAGETWDGIDLALRRGNRGLPGGSSLALLLAQHDRCGHTCRGPRSRSWTPEEDELVRTLPPRETAHRTGRSMASVYQRRRVLGLTAVRRHR
jgi:hypothetical protein